MKKYTVQMDVDGRTEQKVCYKWSEVSDLILNSTGYVHVLTTEEEDKMSEIEVITENGKAVFEFRDETIESINGYTNHGRGDATLFVDTNNRKYVFHISVVDKNQDMLPLMRILDGYEKTLADIVALEAKIVELEGKVSEYNDMLYSLTKLTERHKQASQK